MRARTEGANRPSGGAGEGGPPIRHVILAEGLFDLEWSKTAACIIRYQPGRVVAVLDSTQAGRDAAAVIGYGAGIPVLADLEEALALGRGVGCRSIGHVRVSWLSVRPACIVGWPGWQTSYPVGSGLAFRIAGLSLAGGSRSQ